MKKCIIPNERIEGKIHIIRGQKVMIDEDIAALYGVETRILNQAVYRNSERFPVDFAFRLTNEEWKSLISQFVISNRGGRRKLPLVFTEQGVAMLSGLLHSPLAIAVNIAIMRAFVRLRQALASHQKLNRLVLELRDYVLKRSAKTDQEFRRMWLAIEKLMKPFADDEKKQRKIGFDVS